VKPLNAILRLCVLAALAIGSALLLWSGNTQPPPAQTANGASEKAGQAPATLGSYTELVPPANATEAKACCDKPPTRAALMRGAPPANSP
jgi:hypothetical protein